MWNHADVITTEIQPEKSDLIDDTCPKEKQLSDKDIVYEKGSFIKEFFGLKTELVWWPNIIGIAIVHILGVYALLTYHWTTGIRLALFEFGYGFLGGFGITAGVHRLWCHRSYKAKLPVRIFLMFCFTSCGMYSLLDWVRDHRVHHKFTETDADPHDVRRGFFFSHCGWLMMRKHPEVKRKGKTIDLSDLYEDPVVAFHLKHYMLWTILVAFVVPMVIPLMWGESLYWTFMAAVAKYMIILNMTWSVNSFAHMWGNKPFDRTFKAAENIYVSFVAFGEGWHNYHHKFPWDYRASEFNYFFNVTTFWLDLFAKLGLVYDRKYVKDETIRLVAEKYGDGSRYKSIEAADSTVEKES